jgi:hypothetical protein
MQQIWAEKEDNRKRGADNEQIYREAISTWVGLL